MPFATTWKDLEIITLSDRKISMILIDKKEKYQTGHGFQAQQH